MLEFVLMTLAGAFVLLVSFCFVTFLGYIHRRIMRRKEDDISDDFAFGIAAIAVLVVGIGLCFLVGHMSLLALNAL